LISGIYDIAQVSATPLSVAYYGEDQSAWGACSTLEPLAASSLPLLYSVSELDAAEFHKQAAQMVAATIAARGRYPRMHLLTGHNHVSPLLAVGLGAPLDPLGPLIQQFIADPSA
jgi:triacylglycerol lipase